MSHHRHRRDHAIRPADAARDAHADELRKEIERRLARIRAGYVSAETAAAAYAEPAGANPALPR